MEIVPGFRRLPAAGPLPESDPVLVAQLRDEIRRSGPITFERFMGVVLYDPERGYYAGERAAPGRAGDFLTAPETHPIFGHVLARVLAAAWTALDRPDDFTLVEHAAGSGTLALAILDGLRADGSALLEALRYVPVERAQRRRDELVDRLEAAGFGRVLATGSAHGGDNGSGSGGAGGVGPDASGVGPDASGATAGEVGPRGITGFVLANELVDALPFHRVVGIGGELREVFVGWAEDPESSAGGHFVDVPGEPSTPELGRRLVDEGIELVEGQRGEIRLADEPWMAEVGLELGRGFALVLDYGHEARELYGPARWTGTLRTYLAHMVAAAPYEHVGRSDITAHVDLTSLVSAGRRAGLDHLGTTTQARFLVGSGIGELLGAIQESPATTMAEYTVVRAAVVRMLDPLATGGFRVVAFGRHLAAEHARSALPGLEWRLPA